MIISQRFTPAVNAPEPENSQFPGSRTAISGLRYYSPSLGRFINRDPIEESGGLNLYAFCRNNGVNAWDILGAVEDDALFWRHINPNVPPADPRTARILTYGWGIALTGGFVVSAAPVAIPAIYGTIETGTLIGMYATIRGAQMAYGVAARGAYLAQTAQGVRTLFVAGSVTGAMGVYSGRDYLEGFPDEIAQASPFGWGNGLTYNVGSWVSDAYSRWRGGNTLPTQPSSAAVTAAPTGAPSLPSTGSVSVASGGGVPPLSGDGADVLVLPDFTVVASRGAAPVEASQGGESSSSSGANPLSGVVITVQGGINTRSPIAHGVYWTLFGNSVANGTAVEDQNRNLATANRAGFTMQGYEWLLRPDLPTGLLPAQLYFARAALRAGDVNGAEDALRAYEAMLLAAQLRAERRD